ncbi:MAG: DUF1552 domain-containing protein [Verrucomicrobiales bacterium]|nr:DUF1552 domain-containing protein [Verrucomicrobiales bacterium]
MSFVPILREPLARRTMLRGLGATIALPFLDAMAPRARAAQSRPFPTRIGVLFMPNGVHPERWTPEGEGSAFKLSPILQPLEPHRADINVLTNLGHENCRGGDGHYAKTANWLTGTQIEKTTGKNLRCGVSMDQTFAQHASGQARFPSLELGTEPVMTGVDFNVNYTMLYGSHIAWRTPTSPLPPEINPRFVFDRLFRDNAAQRKASSLENKSVLDLVLSDAKSLRDRVGKDDQQRLDQYLESIRSVEQRIEADIARVASGENLDPAAAAAIGQLDQRITQAMAQSQNPGSQLRLDHTEHCRLMMELMTLAFWSDTTRVSTFMFGWAVSGRSFAFLDGVTHGHHECSHHQKDAGKLTQYEKINTWHVAQFAQMIERMKSIKEGDGTLLDHTLLLFGSSMRDGNAHSPKDLPLVLAGHGGGLPGGRHIAHPKDTPMCNLFLSMLQLAGMKTERFGDSTEPLKGLV